jgi:hypothetical protein
LERLADIKAVATVSDAIVATVNELLTTRDALRRLGAIWRNRRKFRKDSGAERTLDVLPHYPVLTIRRVQVARHLNAGSNNGSRAIDRGRHSGRTHRLRPQPGVYRN